jgi:hypothetical protein
METAIIVAIISSVLSLIGVLSLGAMQYVNWKAMAKVNIKTVDKLQADITASLIDKAMTLNKQEFDTIKQVNDELRKKADEQAELIKFQAEQIVLLENKVVELEKDLEMCKRKVGLIGGESTK